MGSAGALALLRQVILWDDFFSSTHLPNESPIFGGSYMFLTERLAVAESNMASDYGLGGMVSDWDAAISDAMFWDSFDVGAKNGPDIFKMQRYGSANGSHQHHA
jgi:hypothetical protein